MASYDWARFCKRVGIKAEINEIYNAWSRPVGLQQWFLRSAEFTDYHNFLRKSEERIQKGDNYKWMWYGYNDDIVERGTILEANGKNMLKFTFSAHSIVTVMIKTEQNESVVELWQENIPTDEFSKAEYHIGCIQGWTFYLTNLKSFLEGGIDLRNKNVGLQNLVNA